jgi:tetratricopeptide (TPR) repeat protein
MLNPIADKYREEALTLIATYGVLEYMSYFRILKLKQIAKLYEKAAAEYTASDTYVAAAECYFSAAYNFMLAEVSDKAAQYYILAAKMYDFIDYNKSIAAYLHAADVYENHNRTEMCIKCYNNVANIYLREHKFKEAIRFFEMCVQLPGSEGRDIVPFQERIAMIHVVYYKYYSIAITVYDSIIQKTTNEQILYPFMMISILLRILVNEDKSSIERYIDSCLGVGTFLNTDYFVFIRELIYIIYSNLEQLEKKQKMNDCYKFYSKREAGFNNIVVSHLVMQVFMME